MLSKADSDLLKKADGFECSYSDYEVNALDDMMKQVEAGRPLTEKQRAWVERLIEQLEDRPITDD